MPQIITRVFDYDSDGGWDTKSIEVGPMLDGVISTLEPTKSYAELAFTLRNGGSPSYWQPLSDSGHEPINPPTVETDASKIRLTWPDLEFSKVVTFVAVPDETLSESGYTMGASVALGFTDIYLSRLLLGDYISYNGSSWVSANNVFSFTSFTGGVLTLGHAPIGGACGSATGRGGIYTPQLGSLGATSTQVEFYDWDGVKQTVANTNMKAFVNRLAGAQTLIDPRVVPPSGHNIWCRGVMELA